VVAERSPVGKRIETARKERKHHEFPIDGFFAFKEEKHKVSIRVLTSREQDRALDLAHAYVQKAASTESAKRDEDLITDAKTAAIISIACRDPTTPDLMPIWPTLETVKEDCSSDQLGVLVRLILEVRAKFGPTPATIDDEQVEIFARMAAAAAGTDVPETVITPLPHPHLVQLYILTAIKLQQARDAAALMVHLTDDEMATLRERKQAAQSEVAQAAESAAEKVLEEG
jgi:hypothetical protein